MNALIVVLAVIFVVGLAAGAYAIFAPKMSAVPVPPAAPEPVIDMPGPSRWENSAVAEFDALSDAARCDFIFAIGVLEDDQTRDVLLHALDDRSEAVALAAAHALARSGNIDAVRQHVASQDPARREKLMQLLSVMT